MAIASEKSQNILDLATSFALFRICNNQRAVELVLGFARLHLELDDEEDEDQVANITLTTKPKLHLLVHLVRDTSPVHVCPSLYWSYLDESYGGKVAVRRKHRGGRASAPLLG